MLNVIASLFHSQGFLFNPVNLSLQLIADNQLKDVNCISFNFIKTKPSYIEFFWIDYHEFKIKNTFSWCFNECGELLSNIVGLIEVHFVVYETHKFTICFFINWEVILQITVSINIDNLNRKISILFRKKLFIWSNDTNPNYYCHWSTNSRQNISFILLFFCRNQKESNGIIFLKYKDEFKMKCMLSFCFNGCNFFSYTSDFIAH